jgi:hypothetical protein
MAFDHFPLDTIDVSVSAVSLEGLALAMNIVVTDYLGDRSLAKANALDSLATVLHAKSKQLTAEIENMEGMQNV